MTNIIIEISTYIFIAILLGYFFGWLITKIVLKNRYQAKLDDLLLNKNITIHNDADNKDIQIKDDKINLLNNKIEDMKKKQIEIEQRYEKEIDAFLSERVELVEKYKNLYQRSVNNITVESQQ